MKILFLVARDSTETQFRVLIVKNDEQKETVFLQMVNLCR